MMNTLLNRRRAFLAGAAFLALAAAVVHFGPSPLEAQKDTTVLPISFNYGLVKADEVYSNISRIALEEVIPLGADNGYIVAFTDRLVVFRVENRDGVVRNLRLGVVPLLAPGYEDVEEIIVLDDGRSFLVRTSRGVAVWGVTKTAIYAIE